MERQEFENGIYRISNAEYHASTALSRSALMTFKKSPYHYWYQYLSGKYEALNDTKALVFGELVHTWTLEPNLFEEKFVISPNVDRRTKSGKETWLNFEQEAGDKFIITRDEFDRAQKMCLAIRKEGSLAESLIFDSIVEHSIYFTHATSGIQCKVRPDIWRTTIVADLKTSADASYRGFQFSAYKYGYFLQAAMIKQALYANGIEMNRFIFIAVEKEPPYAIGLYMVNDEALDWGVTQFDSLMESFARCRDANKWASYGVQNLCLPEYAKFDIEVE